MNEERRVSFRKSLESDGVVFAPLAHDLPELLVVESVVLLDLAPVLDGVLVVCVGRVTVYEFFLGR